MLDCGTVSDSTKNFYDLAAALIAEHWQLHGHLERLPGENLNFRLETPEADRFVLKITIDREAAVPLEEAVLARLLADGVPVPETIPTVEGEPLVETDLFGSPGIARIQRFLPGQQWRSVGSNRARLTAIGAMVAEIHRALHRFEVEHPDSHRTHTWDLSLVDRYHSTISLFPELHQRDQLERCLHQYRAIALPKLEDCPQGVLHGDPNDENFLLEGDAVMGVVDVGDCQHGALIQDLAISVAYALQAEGATLEDAAILVAGYDQVRALTEVEEEVLYSLAMARLACSALVGILRREEDAQHETWFSHESTTLQAIAANVEIPPNEARNRLFALCRKARDNPPSVEDLRASRTRLLGPSLSVSYQTPLHIVEGVGPYLFDGEGRPFLDLVNNVCHVGHCHPRVVEAIAQQAATLNTNTRYLHEKVTQLAERLVATLPESLDTCFFVNSGSEANELALRLARSATGASDVLVVDGAYHGSTGNAVAMSPYKFNGPGGQGAPDWVHVVPVPDRYRGEFRGTSREVGESYARQVGEVLHRSSQSNRAVAGLFVEPILSCGGQIPLPDGYLASAFEQVREAGGVAVADEVQVGFGRVGREFWGFELYQVVPDIVVMGKPIGNGHPLGAVVTTRAIAEAFDNGMEYFSTFGGNPVSCACGLAVLDVIENEGLQQRAEDLGELFLRRLRDLMAEHSLIGDVRGIGLFLGIEFVRDRDTLEPAATEASLIVDQLRDRGILLSIDGPLHNVIKIKPPMVIDEGDIEMTIGQLDSVLQSID